MDKFLSKLSDQLNYFMDPAMQTTSAIAPAPAPAPAPTLIALAQSLEIIAINILVKDINKSKQSGDPWLSDVKLMRVAEVFRDDEKSAWIYIAFANASKSPVHSREWVRKLL